MVSIQKELEFWSKQLNNQDSDKIILALDKLVEYNHPKIEKILIDATESEKNEKVRIKAIQNLGNLELLDMSNIFRTFKKLLINNSIEIKKATLQAIIKSSDISAIKYLTKYYYSKHSEGVKKEVNEALEILLKVLDKKEPKFEKIKSNKGEIQKKLNIETSKIDKDLDYKKYIKKIFDE